MLTPTSNPVENYLEHEKTVENWNKELDKICRIFNVLPEDPILTAYWAVEYPSLDGIWFTTGRCNFGRKRWYDYFPSANEPASRHRLKATAPDEIAYWDSASCQDPIYFINLLSSEAQRTRYMPAHLARQMGSNLAALQLLADVWDHLLVREKLMPLPELPLNTALFSSVTSLLSWPSLFAQEIAPFHHRPSVKELNEAIQTETLISSRANLEFAKHRCLMKNWLIALRSFSPIMEKACLLRQTLLSHLQAHQAKGLKLIPRWQRQSSNAPNAINDGLEIKNPPADVTPMVMTRDPQQRHIKVYLNSNKRPANETPMTEADADHQKLRVIFKKPREHLSLSLHA
jgi:hypothetical protein